VRCESVIETQSNGLWRTPEREGANALYLWLRIHDAPVNYGDIVALCEDFPKPLSLASLKDVARRSGVAAVIRQGHTDDIIKERKPVIVYLDGADGQHGFFALVLLVNDSDEVILINTTSVILTTMPGDEFRRIWTGHYLTTASDRSIAPWLTVGLIVSLALALKRWKQKRGSN
jgi:ABC-type bacteriocin/lantibiotic exporter with double-glycine peptidase domain